MEEKKGFIAEFKEFINRGNVLDLAVGVVIGGAFSAIITAIVEGLITPILSLILGSDAPFGAIYAGPFAIGAVIDAIIVFLITALVVFLIVKAANKVLPKKEEEPAGPTTEELLAEIRDLLKDKHLALTDGIQTHLGHGGGGLCGLWHVPHDLLDRHHLPAHGTDRADALPRLRGHGSPVLQQPLEGAPSGRPRKPRRLSPAGDRLCHRRRIHSRLGHPPAHRPIFLIHPKRG